MKVLVTGDREWDDIELIAETLEKLPHDTIVIHGAARGADRIAGVVADALGFTVRDYPADWERYKKGAGPVRNRQMFKAEHRPEEPIDKAFAFHNNIESSKGTADMIRVLTAGGVPVELKKR